MDTMDASTSDAGAETPVWRRRPSVTLAGAGLVCLLIGLVLGLLENDRLNLFLHAYLVSFCFLVSIVLGAFFFVAIHHVSRAGWGVAVRRLAEILAANVPLLALLFLPLLIAVIARQHGLYPWTNGALMEPGHEQFNPLIAHKQAYLNVPFFAIRSVGYFVIWWLLTRFFLLRSVEQDENGNPELTVQMERWSGPALLLFALTVTFASFDWLMSLEPEWFSTIFGLYFFAGSVVAGVSTLILTGIVSQRIGRLDDRVTVEHYHDLGKLLFAFVVFWGYMAFSQYLLIWYANIPEETFWYLKRQDGGWMYASLALLAGHLLIPFLGLLSREVKRRKPLLAFWCVWMLVFHWLDLYWLVIPSAESAGCPFGLMDIALMAGMICLYAASVVHVARERSLIPERDPRLSESLAFENF